MNLHILGSSSLVGEAFIELIKMQEPEYKIFLYSRNKTNFINFNSNNFKDFQNYSFGKNSIIVSFCPIWILSKFFEYLNDNNKFFFKEIKTVIACSSSSSITKKYAFSDFDRKLSIELENSENLVLDICKKNKISCIVLQPTLIYGVSDLYKDQNICKLISLMRKYPFIIIPKGSGKRQPIHAFELSKITLFFVRRLINLKKYRISKKIALGGDQELSYEQLLKNIKSNLPKNDRAKNCILITLPPKLFILMIFPFVLISLKNFESILRIFSNLSGFNKVHKILKIKPKKFLYYRFY